MLIARWLRWERRQVAAHWRADLRRGYGLGVWLGGALAARAGAALGRIAAGGPARWGY